MTNTQESIPHLLIVDDDLIVTKLHKRACQRAALHPEPVVCMDGKQAVDYILQHSNANNHHLMLLDINMPVMDGWEVLDKLSEACPECELLVFMATSSVDLSDRNRAGTYKIVLDYITKPLKKDILEAIRSYPELNLYMKAVQGRYPDSDI
jgi:CheY-like chemotaxis protein